MLKEAFAVVVRVHLEVHQNTLEYSRQGILSQSDG